VICSFLLALSGWLKVDVGRAFKINRGYKDVNKIRVRKQLLKRSLQTTLKKDNAEMETEGNGHDKMACFCNGDDAALGSTTGNFLDQGSISSP
jgi:hypothetical protein